MDDRYLWDRGGPPDEEVERLETLLGRYRHRARKPVLPGRPRLSAAMLVAAAVLAGLALLWVERIAPPSSWAIEPLAGSPLVGTLGSPKTDRLRVGQWLETDASSRARLAVSGLGQVDIGPDSRVKLVSSTLRDQRLVLERGKITATISAPPRIFSVETPGATAVDLGCEYTLSVSPDGSGRISVSRGWVVLSWSKIESLVPAGYVGTARSGHGPGTPWVEDAPAGLIAALERFDFHGGAGPALSEILAQARPRDALSVWHLLARTTGEDRVRVYERLAELSPLPAGVTREGALALEPKMLELWRFEMGTPLLASRPSLWNAIWTRLTR
jgi:hypothetical protein